LCRLRRSICLDKRLTGSQFPTHGSDIATLDHLAVSLDHVKCRLLSLAPKTNVKQMLTDAKIMHRKVRQPCRKVRVNVKFVVGRIRQKSQKRLSEHEHRAGRPRLWHVRTDILHGEIRLVALGGGVKLRQLIKEEVTCCYADVVGDP